jgi:hypothetical protein
MILRQQELEKDFLMPTANWTVHPEIRYDSVDGAQAVQPYNGGLSSTQFMFGVDAILLF